MLNLKLSRIQIAALVIAAGLQALISAPAFAESADKADAGATIKAEETTKLAMNPVAIEPQKSERTVSVDPALERKLRRELSSYVADVPLSAY